MVRPRFPATAVTLVLLFDVSRAFVARSLSSSPVGGTLSAPSAGSSPTTLLRMGNFFADLFQDAFSNDERLSADDRTTGQLDYEGEDDESLDKVFQQQQQTEVQKRWAASQQKLRRRKQEADRQRNALSTVRGAPVNPDLLVGTRWSLDLWLAGIPARDPSSDLYGNKVNISSRDRTLGIGAELPERPNLSVIVTLLDDGVCSTEPSDFTTGVTGEYRLSEDRKFLRFSLDTLGFSRVVTTTGTITKVAWSRGPDTVSKTSSNYSIPPGWVYCDTPVGYGRPGELVMGEPSSSKADASTAAGVLRVERRTGILGAATKMVSCGKFRARMLPTTTENDDDAATTTKGGTV